MKIFKVTLDPSNPIQQLVKIPAGSDYGLQILWDYEKYPKFVGTDVDTNNGKLYLDDKVVNTERIKDIDGTPNPANPLDTIYKDGQQTLKIDYNKKLENVGDFVVYKYTNIADSTGLGTIKVIAVDTSTLDYDNEGLAYNFIKETNTAGSQTITIDGIHQVGIKSTYGNILVDGKTGVDIKGSTEGISLTGPSINLNSQNGKINIGSETLSPTIKLNGCTIPETIKNNTGIIYNSDTSTLQWTITGGNINNTNAFLIGEPFLNTYIAVNPTCSAIDIKANTLLLNGTNIAEIAGGSGGGSIEGISPDSLGGGPLANIMGPSLVVGYPDFSKNVMINGDDIMLASGNNGTNLWVTETSINPTANQDINITAPTIKLNGGDKITLCTSSSMINFQDNQIVLSSTGNLILHGDNVIELNGAVYINGELYQGGGGSSVDYMYSITNAQDSSCVNLFIGNTNIGTFNDKVYINGNRIIIGDGTYEDDGWNTSIGYNTNDLILKTTNLDFCINMEASGQWKINGYKIDLDRFLQEFGEWVG